MGVGSKVCARDISPPKVCRQRSPEVAGRMMTLLGLCFSSDGRCMAILHRKDHQDYVVVYECAGEKYAAVHSMQCPETAFLEDVCFAPIQESRSEARPPLYAWEAPAFSGRVFLFSSDGQTCKVISSERTDVGSDAGKIEALPAGFERVVWSGQGWLAAMVADAVSFTLWNSIGQKMGPRIVLGPQCVREGETVSFGLQMLTWTERL